MEKVISKNFCTGCNACATVCPKDAITMIEDSDGFKYPVIDQEKCIDCGLCQRTCPILNTKNNDTVNKCFVAYNKDENIINESSSGGIFTLLADKILDQKGIVVGAAFDENNKLKHVAISKKDELDKLKGSKYLQSDLDNIFTYIKEQVKDKKLLFVGTPCQVAGLKSIIKDNNNLICVDLVCHGVPSQKLFDKYIKELEEKNNSKLLNYNFRDKSTGWDTYSNKAIFNNSEVKELARDNKYMKIFLSDIALRESCYNCNFKLGNKYSDITLGDFWGINNYYPYMYNNKGVSAIIINTSNGEEIFNDIKGFIEYKDCDIDEIIEGNPSIKISSKKHKKRENFMKELDELTFSKLYKKYYRNSNIGKKIVLKILSKLKK